MRRDFKTVGIEAFVIGLVIVVMGFISTRALSMNKFPKLNDPNLNIMLLNYFILGSFSHIIFEVAGLNAWFCKRF